MSMIDTRSTAPTVMVPNIVELVNEGDYEFNMKYGPNHRLILQPGEKLTVNEEVAWQFLGRWWMDNSDPRNRDRVGEYKRLRTLYGAYEDDIAWEYGTQETGGIPRKPALKAYTPTGRQIISVIDDPDGTQGGTQTQLGQEQSLQSQIVTLQNHVLALQAQAAREDAAERNESQPVVPTDAPTPGQNAPTNPAPLKTVGEAVRVPVAPPTIDVPGDPDADEVFGHRLPVVATVVHDPSEVEVEEDAPQAIPHGVSATGGRPPRV